MFDDDDERYANTSDGLTTDEYGSGSMLDLLDENTARTILLNHTAPPPTGKLNSTIISQGTVAWGGIKFGEIFNDRLIANVLLRAPRKEFRKSVTIWRRYEHELGVLFSCPCVVVLYFCLARRHRCGHFGHSRSTFWDYLYNLWALGIALFKTVKRCCAC